ncbi:MAG TPA: SiaB family protein kinase [Salinivirga sp.]|uniref:SiaB family protein kinase n=1 Tax=Salinivirga sp. TaxID=1970192 RepID=UPI002B45DD5D|nr:SiaB family protein kinase [Salinivirga sp.]HKK58206.1 SiaB family protein kinase [Salinivirga sp.]
MTLEQETTFKIYDILDTEGLSYFYRGDLTASITDGILALTETNLTKANEPVKVKKRVYTILVEGLQNITRHQDETGTWKSFFGVEQSGEFYYITMANIILNENQKKLTSQLDKINSLEKEELKDFYKKTLMENELSEKGGAGLGLIEMARKSGNKLQYAFKKLDDKWSYFYLRTYIKHNFAAVNSDESHLNFGNIFDLHEQLDKENVLIIFNGIFNQESLINLLSIIESQMAGQAALKKKVFNIMVELLQNIVKHGISPIKQEGNPGLFYISYSKNGYKLHTGNYIKPDKIDSLKENIDKVNNLNNEELNEFYDKRLFNFQIDNNKESGLGLIELRMKSNSKLKYAFKETSEKYTFFTIEVTIKD